MRWNLRDLRGHFAKPPDVGELCPHHCCQGARKHPRRRPVQHNAVVVRTLEQADELGRKRAREGLPARPYRAPRGLREQLRAEMRTAMHAQEQRAQRYSLGYKTERAGFYGSDKHAQADQVEKVLRVQAADREARAYAEHEREQREQHRPMSQDEQKEYGDVLGSLGW